jgi:hypothetical protein
MQYYRLSRLNQKKAQMTIIPSGDHPPSPTLEADSLFCHDLPSNPLTDSGKILIMGASGYVEGQLVQNCWQEDINSGSWSGYAGMPFYPATNFFSTI